MGPRIKLNLKCDMLYNTRIKYIHKSPKYVRRKCTKLAALQCSWAKLFSIHTKINTSGPACSKVGWCYSPDKSLPNGLGKPINELSK